MRIAFSNASILVLADINKEGVYTHGGAVKIPLLQHLSDFNKLSMINKKFVPIILVAVFICLLVVVSLSFARIYLNTKKASTQASVPNADSVQLGTGTVVDISKIIYDAKITIPNTHVTVSYPKLGYDGKGVTLGRSRAGGLMVYEKIGGVYVVSKLNGKSTDVSVGGDPMATIDIYKLNGEKTLEEVMKYIFDNQMPENQNNHYEMINGVRYYVESDPSGEIKNAYTLMNDHLVNVILQTSHKEIMSDLFTQILSNIDYSCKGDCSVNANEIIEMGKERFGGEE